MPRPPADGNPAGCSVKNVITGSVQVDGGILVVAGSDVAASRTREYVILARQVGVEHLVVAINKVGQADAELVVTGGS